MDETPPPALLVPHRKFSLIWVIPLATALAGLWLGARSYEERGVDVTIVFDSAAGIEAGKTRIKYKDADLGGVTRVSLADDLSHIVVEAKIEKNVKPYLTQDAHFWIARPSIVPSRFSGLGTIISGPYIEFGPGDKAARPSRHFNGEEPSAIQSPDAQGTIYKLHTSHLRGVDHGTALYFHGIPVGKVLGYELSDVDGGITVYAFVQAPHDALVRTATHFWNVSGIALHAGSDGLDVRMESFQSFITGGIAFDLPEGVGGGGQAGPNTDFTLYTDQNEAQDSVYALRLPFMLHLPQPATGLGPGGLVRLQGIEIGHVVSVEAAYDADRNRLSLPVTIEIEPERLALLHHKDRKVRSASEGYGLFEKLVASGLRARLGMGNLLTGQKTIDLVMLPDAPQAHMLKGGAHPEIPVVRSNDLDTLMDSAQALMSNLKTTAGHIDESLQDGDGGGDLAGTLHEVKDAARSLRALTDDLDNHPESLLWGKSGK